MASVLRPPSRVEATARARWTAAFSSVWLRSFDEMKRNHDSLCARLERTSVSTWRVLKWMVSMLCDLGGAASRPPMMNGVEAACSWTASKHPCLHLSALGSGSAKVVQGVPPPA